MAGRVGLGAWTTCANPYRAVMRAHHADGSNKEILRMSDETLHEPIAEAKEDELGLWQIIAEIQAELGATDERAVRASTMTWVRRLLDSGEVRAGYYRPDGTGIEIWDLEREAVVSRTLYGWYSLGRAPSIGEVVLFVGTERS